MRDYLISVDIATAFVNDDNTGLTDCEIDDRNCFEAKLTGIIYVTDKQVWGTCEVTGLDGDCVVFTTN